MSVVRRRPLAVAAASALVLTGVLVAPSAANALDVPIGAVAGQTLSQCSDHSLSPDAADGYSVPLDFARPLDFLGHTYTKFRVRDTGGIFLSNADDSDGGTVAAGEFDTNLSEGGDVTYGVGANGVVCANWHHIAHNGFGGDVGNTFQIILTPMGGTPGRVDGDFDITLNYDSIVFPSETLNTIGYVPSVLSPTVDDYFYDTAGDHNDYEDTQSRALTGHTNTGVEGRYLLPIQNVASASWLGTLAPVATTVSGGASVGSTLTASTGIWGPGTVALSNSWTRNGVTIPGATAATYTITSADAGTTVAAVVTGARDFYRTLSVASAGVAVPPLPTPVVVPITTPAPFHFTAGKVTISGTLKVGKKLKAVVTKWTPKPTFGYQWLANGKAIKKATKASLTLTKALKDKKISVRVTGVKVGYVSAVVTSKRTAKVK